MLSFLDSGYTTTPLRRREVPLAIDGEPRDLLPRLVHSKTGYNEHGRRLSPRSDKCTLVFALFLKLIPTGEEAQKCAPSSELACTLGSERLPYNHWESYVKRKNNGDSPRRAEKILGITAQLSV